MINKLLRSNLKCARLKWGSEFSPLAFQVLKAHTNQFQFSIADGDRLLLDWGWYVTHAGLVRLALRSCCGGIDVRPVVSFCDTAASRWAFKATVYKSRTCKGFVGYGDADPSNVSPLVHGAEMRVAETRAVNRALRKAYGIGICSVEEIGSFAEPAPSSQESKKLPPPASQWQERQLRRPQGSRPPLPAHPPAPTRCQPGQGLPPSPKTPFVLILTRPSGTALPQPWSCASDAAHCTRRRFELWFLASTRISSV